MFFLLFSVINAMFGGMAYGVVKFGFGIDATPCPPASTLPWRSKPIKITPQSQEIKNIDKLDEKKKKNHTIM